jgi:hypothetical protein
MELLPFSATDEPPYSIPKILHDLLCYRARHVYRRIGVLEVVSEPLPLIVTQILQEKFTI